MERRIKLGRLLKYYRKFHSVTQEYVAELAQINDKYYGRIERGESIPTVDKFFALCDALEIEAAQFCFALDRVRDFSYLLLDSHKDLLEAQYIKENDSDCSAIVDVGGLEEAVYNRSRVELSKYIDIQGQRVWLKKTVDEQECNYRYSLFTLNKNNIHILLNLDELNQMFEELYYIGALKGYSIYRESVTQEIIEDCKFDFYFPEENLLIENRAILDKSNHALYPMDNIEQTQKELELIYQILQKGYQVKYNIFILTPWVNSMSWKTEIESLMETVQKEGMQIKIYYLFYENGVLKAQAAKLDKKTDNLFDIMFV